MHTMLSSILAGLTNLYLGLVRNTSVISISGDVQQGEMLGYWHGESMLMMLMLGKMPWVARRTTVVVTADGRGDVIEKVLHKHGSETLRAHDGMAARHALKDIKRACAEGGRTIATALDGPTGPYKQPKALLIRLAERENRELIFAGFECKRVLHMNRRWDKYTIPLPFSKISATFTAYKAQPQDGNSPALEPATM